MSVPYASYYTASAARESRLDVCMRIALRRRRRTVYTVPAGSRMAARIMEEGGAATRSTLSEHIHASALYTHCRRCSKGTRKRRRRCIVCCFDAMDHGLLRVLCARAQNVYLMSTSGIGRRWSGPAIARGLTLLIQSHTAAESGTPRTVHTRRHQDCLRRARAERVDARFTVSARS